MGIALVIMGGMTLITIFAIIGDIITKTRRVKAPQDGKALEDITRRVEALEIQVQSRDERIRQLENDVSFANKLLEEKHD